MAGAQGQCPASKNPSSVRQAMSPQKPDVQLVAMPISDHAARIAG